MARIRPVLLMLAALVLLTATSARAQGDLQILGSFNAGDVQLDVATFELEGDKVALLGIRTPSGNTSFAFSPHEWTDTFVPMWKTSWQQHQAGSTSWTPVGHMEETDTEQHCKLDLETGPSVRFTITDPELGRVPFVLPAKDGAAFSQAVEKVNAFLAR